MLEPTPIGGESTWRRGDLNGPSLIYHFDDLPLSAKSELNIIARRRAPNIAIEAEQEPPTLPLKAEAFVGWVKDQVFNRQGVMLLRGLPVPPSDEATCRSALTAMLEALGTVLPQNTEGEPVYTVVDRSDPRGFYGGSKATGALRYHTDQAAAPESRLPDLLALWCLQPAEEGGDTILASGHALHDALLAAAPELVARLYQDLPFGRDADGVSSDPPVRSPVFRKVSDQVRVRYNDYFVRRGSEQIGEKLDACQEEALAAGEELLNSHTFDEVMRLEAGDLLLVDNRTVLHNRTAYSDSNDETLKRRLLRGWARCDPASRQ